MSSSNKNARAAWATLTHDSLSNDQRKHTLNRVQFIFLNLGLLLGNILVLFNTGAFAAAVLHATGDLGVSPSHASWMQTYYFISMALSLPVSSWLAKAVGEVRLYRFSMIAMALASLVCAVTGNLYLFLLGRALQGFSGGLTIPLSQTLLMREYPEKTRAVAVSLWSMAALSPFTLGPSAGGWVADHLGWRWLFYLNIPLPLFSAALARALLFDRRSERLRMPFDVIGLILLAATLFCLQSVLNRGQDADWFNSPSLMLTAFAGLLMLSYFIIWELSEPVPLLDLRLLTRRNFAIGSVVLSLGFMMLYGLLSVLLVRLQVVAGYTAFLAGSVLLPMVFLAKPMASIMHHIVNRFDARQLACINMLAFSLYCYINSQYDFFGRGGWFSKPLWSQVLEGFCLGGLFVPLTTLFLSGLTPSRQIQAVELGGMLRVLGGSIASPLLGVFWERRAAFHKNRLLESFSLFDDNSRAVFEHLQSIGMNTQLATARISAITKQHAAILGLNDTFMLCTLLFLGLAALVWLADPVGPKPAPTAKEEQRVSALEDLMEEP